MHNTMSIDCSWNALAAKAILDLGYSSSCWDVVRIIKVSAQTIKLFPISKDTEIYEDDDAQSSAANFQPTG